MNRGYSIQVTIERAEGLRAADSNGKSDPYVVYSRLTPDAETRKTKVIPKTLDPVWNEHTSWLFDASDSKWGLCFDIYDKDLVGKDFLGYAEIDLKAEIAKEKKEEKHIVLELGPGPKTSDKTAKKVTGKLHLTVKYPPVLLLDDESRQKIESTTEVSLGDSDEIIRKFHEVSGGAATISDKKQMALLAADGKIFMSLLRISANSDTTGFTDEIIREVVTANDTIDYFSRVMLIITDSKKEGVISLPNYISGYSAFSSTWNIFDDYQPSPKRDQLVFDLMDVDGDGVISDDDLMAFHAFFPTVVKRKMCAEFMKDNRAAAMRQKAGKASYEIVIEDMYKKFEYPSTLRSMVIGLTTHGYELRCNMKDIKLTKEELVKYLSSKERMKAVQAGSTRNIQQMMKEHNKTASFVLENGLRRHGCDKL